MNELEKIAYAKSYINKLANGVNPLDDSVIPDADVINNVRLSRCLFYVSDILQQVIDNGGIIPAAETKEKKAKKKPYALSPEEAERFEYSDAPLTTTEIMNRIAAIGPKEGVKKFPRRNLLRWLFTLELIEEVNVGNYKIRRPTKSGADIGIILEERLGQYGNYNVIVYNLDAQHFIIDNIEAVLAFDNKVYKSKMNLDNQGKSWDKEQDEMLVGLYNRGFTVNEIAKSLKRGEKAIRIRLRKYGIDPDSVIKYEEYKS